MIDSFESSPRQFLVRPARHHDVEAVADILAWSFYADLLSPSWESSAQPPKTSPSLSQSGFGTYATPKPVPSQNIATALGLSHHGQVLGVGKLLARWVKQSLWQLIRWGIVIDLQQRLREDSPHHAWLVVVDLVNPQCPLATLEICLRSGTTNLNAANSAIFQNFRLNSFWLPRGQYPYVFNVAVHPQFRRRGLARQLLQTAERAVKGWGYTKIVMHVLDSNHGARHLYAQQGYQVVGIEGKIWSWLWQRPYKLVLQKSLALENPYEPLG